MPLANWKDVYANPIGNVLIRPEDYPTAVPEGEAPNFIDTFSAAARTLPNTGVGVVTELARLQAWAFDANETPESMLYDTGSGAAPVEGYSPFADPAELADVDPEQFQNFYRSRSPAETAYIKRRIRSEQATQKVLAKSGKTGVATALALGMSDPLTIASMVIPVAAPEAWGTRAERIGAALAATTATDAGYETILHQNQELRTYKDTLLNMGGSALLGAGLGMWATRVPKTEFDAIARALDESPTSDSLSAARVGQDTTLEDEGLAKGGETIAKLFGFNPITRGLTSPSKAVRVLIQRLANVTPLLRKNVEKGLPTLAPVEAAIVQRTRKSLINVMESADTAYGKYTKRVGKGVLSQREFGVKLSAAMRRGDVSDIPEVSEAARLIRKQFDADREEFAKLGVLPEDLDTVGAVSYFPRVYDHGKMLREEGLFKRAVRAWIEKNPKLPSESPAVKAARQRLGDWLDGSSSRLEKATADAEGSRMEAEGSVKTLSERKRDVVNAQRDLRKADKTSDDIDAKLTDLMERKQQIVEDIQASPLAERTKPVEEEVAKAEEGLAAAREQAKAATKAVVDNRDSYRAAQKALDKADREVDEIEQTLSELEAQKQYLPEEASGASPEKLAAMQRRLDREIERARTKGIIADEKRQSVRQQAIEAENNRARLKAEAKASRAAMREATQGLRDARQTLRATKEEIATVERTSAQLDRDIERTRARALKVEEITSQRLKRLDELAAEVGSLRQSTKDTVRLAREAKRIAKKFEDDADVVRKFEKDLKEAKERHRDPAEIDATVDDIYRHIMGLHHGNADLGRLGSPRPLKSRVLDVPDEILEPWLISNFDDVMRGYTRTTAAHIEMRKEFGSIDLGPEKREISEEFDRLARQHPERAEKLRKKEAEALADIDGLTQRLLGNIGPAGGKKGIGWVRAGRIVRQWNYGRSLGGQTLSSLAGDSGHLISKYGLVKTGKALATFLGNVKVNKANAQRMATAADAILETRYGNLGEIVDDFSAGSGKLARLERAGHNASQLFTRITLMQGWNNTLKNLTTLLEQDAMLRAIRNPEALSKFKRGQLAATTLTDEDIRVIAEQFAKHGTDEDGLLRAATDLWDDTKEAQNAARKFESVLISAGDTMTMTRGVGDTPLIMDSELVKTLIQFRSFGVIAVNRLMIPVAQGLAHGDAATYSGLTAMLALGAMTGVLKDVAAGQAPDLAPDRLVKDGLQWSGLMGWTADASDLLTAHGTPWMRENLTLSKYPSRQPVETALGPTLGTVLDVSGALRGTTDEEGFDAKDLHRYRKLMWAQNLVGWRRVVDAIEGETAEAFDLPGHTVDSFWNRMSETKPAE